ncbi:AraC family transcriptional regulator [Bifidobacterium avesanii]|uniref:AraC family transcriptional regulator n=1 Tax=Bifidobacterium avesanii TaxID=1798157 RepID=A0A7K3TJ45_9BIFI|nr:AraC family transcriptional regulator [Bifidobacterium avesanii]KAB8289583.1 AraC family transcriptional regulator [Bifidobacterium avesanii]NEG79138.1 AraC family transcriptional regulator [Bifidobacterium avesanii]
MPDDPMLTVTVTHDVKPPRILFRGAAREEGVTRSSWGPNVRDDVSVRVVLSGRGEFMLDGVNHHVRAGQAFAIPKDVPTFYHTDFHAPQPWSLCWVNFDGPDAGDVLQRCGFTVLKPVLNLEDVTPFDEIVGHMLAYSDRSYSNGMMLQGLLLAFLSTLIGSVTSVAEDLDPRDNRYLDAAVNYIHEHINEPLQVADVAAALYISRAYLCTVFQTNLKITPKIFIMKAKIFQAAEDIRHSPVPIAQLAERYGYATPFAFSKSFKRIMGMSPRDFRERFSAPDDLVVEQYRPPTVRRSPASRL